MRWPSNMMEQQILEEITREIRRRMVKESVEKILKCMDHLSEDEIWFRPNESSNSVGNLILHLCGNLRQYILSGVDGQKDIRVRQQEFDARNTMNKSDLKIHLKETIKDVDQALTRIDATSLTDKREVQCFKESLVGMLIHVTEHFSYHTGQIVYYTKMLRNKDLAFYAGLDLDAKGGG